MPSDKTEESEIENPGDLPPPSEIIRVKRSGESICVSHDPPNEDVMADTWPLTVAEAHYLRDRLIDVLG